MFCRGPCDDRIGYGYEATFGCSGSGSGMNSVSPGTLSNRAAFQSAFACSIRSGREDTNFHQYMARPVHRIAAQKHEAGRLDRANGDPVAGPEHQKLARPEAVARDLDQPRDRVEAALLVGRIERNARPRLKLRV